MPPNAVQVYLAWWARRLIARGFSAEDAFRTLEAKYGPAAKLPGRPDRALAKLDDLIRRICEQDGWSVPARLELPSHPQANAHRREQRRAAQGRMFTRLAKIRATLTVDACPECAGSRVAGDEICVACDGSGSALMAAALRDRQMRELAASVAPAVERPRGRPRKATQRRRPAVPAHVDDEITEAVVRYVVERPDA